MSDEAINDLRAYLASMAPGDLSGHASELRSLLIRAWDTFAGSSDAGMEARKLDRIDNLTWDPPRLEFEIERHGAVVAGGSSRAERQGWTLDIERCTASCGAIGYRQIRTTSPRLDVRPLASELANLIEAGASDDRLRWSPDMRRVTVAIGRVIPDAGPQQTVQDRRRRFRKALVERLSERWGPGPTANSYERLGHCIADTD